MAGPSAERAERILRDANSFRAEAAVITIIPGASHCAYEGAAIAEEARRRLDIPAVEIEIPVLADSVETRIRTRLEALVEVVLARRSEGGRS